LQKAELYSRIHSVYAVSSGADIAAYFLARQTKEGVDFFLNYLTKPEFIDRQPLRYLWQICRYALDKRYKVKDVVNTGYVVEVAQRSAVKLNAEELQKSGIPFFIKVFDVDTLQHSYVSASTGLFKKLQATSTASPLSHQAVSVDGHRYIDGDSIASDLDAEVMNGFKDKTVIQIINHPPATPSVFMELLAACMMGVLFGGRVFRSYVMGYWYSAPEVVAPNAIIIKNDISCSLVSTDQVLLKRLYEHGKVKGAAALEASNILWKKK
jgi:hypothetical protein